MSSKRVSVANPIVEIDGDDMARVIHHLVKDQLISPHVDVKTQYFDCSLEKRSISADQVMRDAIDAIKQVKVAVKCATHTPSDEEPSNNAKGRNVPSANTLIAYALGGTMFREPIMFSTVPHIVTSWKYPIVVARCVHGERNNAKEIVLEHPGKLQLRFTPADGTPCRLYDVYDFPASGGVVMASTNTPKWIGDFARTVFRFALGRKLPVYLSTKVTVLPNYDGLFVQTFKEIYDAEFASQFAAAGLKYNHVLIDDMVALSLRGEGGFVWACKNYDGTNQSEMVAQGFGSIGLMTSVLVSADGSCTVASTAHGTIPRHYTVHRSGKQTSTNPIPTIMSWVAVLRRRGEMDGNTALIHFADDLQKAVVLTVEGSIMTNDLSQTVTSVQFSLYNTMTRKESVTTSRFIEVVSANLQSLRAQRANSP